MKIISSKFILVIVLLLALNTLSEVAIAMNQSKSSFSVRPILPENQERAESTFFDLRMEAGQEQILEVEIVNNTRERIMVEAAVLRAITNNNGLVEYRLPSQQSEENLVHLVEELITVPKYIELPPLGVYFLPVEILMPEQGYNGVLAGALKLQRITAKEELKVKGVRNTYSFVIAILLHQGRKVEPEVVSQGTKVEFVEGKGTFTTNFQNTERAFIGQLAVDTTIINRQTRAKVFENRVENIQMAPNSNFYYSIQVEQDRLSRGIYIISQVLESEGRVWSFKEYMELVEKPYLRAYLHQKEESTKLEQGGGLWVALIMGVPVFIIIICWLRCFKPPSLKKKDVERICDDEKTSD